MNNPLKFTAAIALIGSTLLLQSCSEQAKEPLKEDKFVVTDTLIQRLKIDTVRDANPGNRINFSARITANEDRMTKIYPMVSGIVRTVPAKLGDRVNAGQVLATMSSADMAGFDKEAISASAALKNAQRQLVQAEALFKSGLSSAREVELAQNELQTASAENQRSKVVLSLNGGSKNGIYTLKSPITGYVIDKSVTNNMQLRPDNNESLFTIADLSDVWGIVNIYESDIATIKEGDDVIINILSYPDKKFTGKINKIYNILDNESKVMNARVVIKNPENMLKPGMMAGVQIEARSQSSFPVIDASCIIFDDNKNYVVVLDKNRKLRIQEIQIDRKTGNDAYISSGLRPGDLIVASKQVFLYESLKN